MWSDIKKVYRESLKNSDSLFNTYLARPLATPLVVLFAKTRVTPNQVSFLSVLPMIAGMVAWIAMPGPVGLLLGVLGLELSYILDCVDGQLARMTGRTSPVGGLLDFFLDEVKAILLVGAIAVRWQLHDDGGVFALFVGLGAMASISLALMLTKFIRTDEYAEATGTARQRHGTSAGAAHQRKGVLWPVEMAVRLISQYPTTLPIFAFFNRLDLFLWAYAIVHLLYIARTGLVVLIKLGRFAPAEPPPE